MPANKSNLRNLSAKWRELKFIIMILNPVLVHGKRRYFLNRCSIFKRFKAPCSNIYGIEIQKQNIPRLRWAQNAKMVRWYWFLFEFFFLSRIKHVYNNILCVSSDIGQPYRFPTIFFIIIIVDHFIKIICHNALNYYEY